MILQKKENSIEFIVLFVIVLNLFLLGLVDFGTVASGIIVFNFIAAFIVAIKKDII